MLTIRLTHIAMVFLVIVPLLPCAKANDLSVADESACEQRNQRTISVSVSDPTGTAVENLRPVDLVLSENKALRQILKLERKIDQPLSVAILIDASASQ